MCIDYRISNKQTHIDRYPLSCIDKILDCLSNTQYSTKTQIVSGYHQIQIEEGHEFKTAFTCGYNTYEFLVMPFGLTNAPSTFQRLMGTIFADLLDLYILVYLENILFFSESVDAHAQHVAKVLSCLQEHELFAKHSKHTFVESTLTQLVLVI